jgi:hypothetical protein
MSEVESIVRAIRARGEYLYFIYNELKEEIGAERAESILSRAIRRYGQRLGKNIGPLKEADDLFDRLEKGNPPGVFERHFKVRNHDESVMQLDRCPLVEAWRDLGCSSKEIQTLCNIAMEGDFGIFDGESVEMALESSIGKGDTCCIMKIRKK